MNSSVWTNWAAQEEKNSISEQLLMVVFFFNFLWAKMNFTFLNIVASAQPFFSKENNE